MTGIKWNLRLAAAQRDIWKASHLQRMLAERGLEISSGKMSNLWSGQPASIKLSDLAVICAVLNCTPSDLLVVEPDKLPQPIPHAPAKAVGQDSDVTPRPRSGRTLPPR
ncbi:hypothetical protein GCM10023194_44780 [Planotetraspora phitsanulokensis]|uniref:HTH cro/C1-type domain-containing protein n=1 Tax=Planotetraspora phitsanulokensis TaxID=575192 RepID=A0A8J3U446_9ACTN|nr:helix-turn-helix transcriptional regulator [Planotetraspora phitsanulokensis]GII38079.1 hypothetical protein Pph01_30820 [Planotetraspora phitsanulokensis]